MTTRTLMKFQRLILTGISVSLGMLITSAVTNAHKPITSKYTYNEHIYPIVIILLHNCFIQTKAPEDHQNNRDTP